MKKILTIKNIFLIFVIMCLLTRLFSGYSRYLVFKEIIYPTFSTVSHSEKILEDMFWKECGVEIITTILVLIVFLLYCAIKLYNKLASKKEEIQSDYANIDVFLKHRFDLIPNLVDVVKESCDYEKGLLDKIVKLREEYYKSYNKISEKEKLNNEYNRIIILLENYPALKASKNFLELQKQLIKEESQLQAARRTYNIDVTEYNTLLGKFPNNVIGGILGFKQEKLLELVNNS